MPNYVVLMNWTDQGVKSARDTVRRYRESRAMLEPMGVRITQIFWTIGRYDIVALGEAPDDQTMSAALLRLASAGNLRTETLRAFSEQEMDQIVQRLG